MKILFIVPYTPNLIRVRPYQLLRALVARGHQVTVATLWSTSEEQAQLAELTRLGLQVEAVSLSRWRSLGNTLRAVPTLHPLQARYCWHPRLAHRIHTLLQTTAFDVVHVEHLRGAAYGLDLQQRLAAKRPPVVWDSVDCISHLFQQAAGQSKSLQGRLMTRLDLARTRRFEGYLVQQFDLVTITSPGDKRALEQLSQRWVQQQRPVDGRQLRAPSPIHVLPNGVDLDCFQPGAGPREPATLLFSGKLSYHANVSAALHLVREIMPRVWAHRPEVHVWLVGKDPTSEVSALATHGRVTVTGTVPALPPYLQRTTLAVAPVLYGAGIQNKVLEAMACATPVIASPQACSALQVHPGRDLVVASDAGSFAQSILALLEQPQQRAALGSAARRYVEQHHCWAATATQLEQLYALARLQ